MIKSLGLFPKAVIVTGAGFYINSFVGDQLAAQNITTPADASIPNAPVNSIPTALSMANITQQHAANYSGGLNYAQMGRFAVESGDPAGTSNPDEALLDAAGNPVPNPARNTQLTAAGLVTSLSLSAMALGIAFVVLGLVVTGLGYALLGLITPKVAQRYGLQPVVSY